MQVVSGAISVLPLSASFRKAEFRHLHAFAVSAGGFRHSHAFAVSAGGFLKSCSSSYNPKHYNELYNFRAGGLVARASASDSNDNLVPFGPLQFESPVGQLLEQIANTRPHLLPAAIDQQLENLQTVKDAHQKESSTTSNDSLYWMIAEFKEKQMRTTLEEILYCLVAHKFLENNISMIQKISATDSKIWPDQEEKLKAVHSPEALKMVESYLSHVREDRLRMGTLPPITLINKIEMGNLYADSISHGYFLKGVDKLFQLERAMGTLPKDFEKVKSFNELSPGFMILYSNALYNVHDDISTDKDKSLLRRYMMRLDPKTIQGLVNVRSKEANSLIEKQSQALFDISVSNHELFSLTFSGMITLVLEAVAFGSFLWEKENYVESKYPFLMD